MIETIMNMLREYLTPTGEPYSPATDVERWQRAGITPTVDQAINMAPIGGVGDFSKGLTKIGGRVGRNLLKSGSKTFEELYDEAAKRAAATQFSPADLQSGQELLSDATAAVNKYLPLEEIMNIVGQAQPIPKRLNLQGISQALSDFLYGAKKAPISQEANIPFPTPFRRLTQAGRGIANEEREFANTLAQKAADTVSDVSAETPWRAKAYDIGRVHGRSSPESHAGWENQLILQRRATDYLNQFPSLDDMIEQQARAAGRQYGINPGALAEQVSEKASDLAWRAGEKIGEKTLENPQLLEKTSIPSNIATRAVHKIGTAIEEFFNPTYDLPSGYNFSKLSDAVADVASPLTGKRQEYLLPTAGQIPNALYNLYKAWGKSGGQGSRELFTGIGRSAKYLPVIAGGAYAPYAIGDVIAKLMDSMRQRNVFGSPEPPPAPAPTPQLETGPVTVTPRAPDLAQDMEDQIIAEERRRRQEWNIPGRF
jgi:hypothetical protein